MSHLIQAIFFDASMLVGGSVIPHFTHVCLSISITICTCFLPTSFLFYCFACWSTLPGLICSRNGACSNFGSSDSTSLSLHNLHRECFLATLLLFWKLLFSSFSHCLSLKLRVIVVSNLSPKSLQRVFNNNQ